jgi:putative SOS response-associated peptidase YedK
MPTPPKFLEGKKAGGGVTNIRNVGSSHWRRWLGVESRCLVPFTSFAEPDNGTYGGRAPVWFAFDASRPLAAFAGLWTRWKSVRKAKEGEVEADIFGFLTINPNAEVGAIHPKPCPSSCGRRRSASSGCPRPGPRLPNCSGRCRTAR